MPVCVNVDTVRAKYCSGQPLEVCSDWQLAWVAAVVHGVESDGILRVLYVDDDRHGKGIPASHVASHLQLPRADVASETVAGASGAAVQTDPGDVAETDIMTIAPDSAPSQRYDGHTTPFVANMYPMKWSIRSHRDTTLKVMLGIVGCEGDSRSQTLQLLGKSVGYLWGCRT